MAKAKKNRSRSRKSQTSKEVTAVTKKPEELQNGGGGDGRGDVESE